MATGGLARPGQHFDQLALPVALDSRDTQNLAGAQLERDAAHGWQSLLGGRREILDA